MAKSERIRIRDERDYMVLFQPLLARILSGEVQFRSGPEVGTVVISFNKDGEVCGAKYGPES